MPAQSTAEWVVGVTSNPVPSRSRTLAALVAAARAGRPDLASLNRKRGGSARLVLKRAVRFTRSHRAEASEAKAGALARIARRRKKPLLIRFEGTDVRDSHTRMAAACLGGRAVPRLWASSTGSKRRRSQNALEERLLSQLEGPLPGTAEVIILAGRGFGRAAWAAVCQERGFRYLVRVKPDVTIVRARDRGVLRK